jgi:nitrogen PTS system EIIA component
MFPLSLREDLVRMPLAATSCEGALVELIAMLPASRFNAQQKSHLLEILLQREYFETTAVGGQVALPHCVLPGAQEPVSALGISRKGIAYSSDDSQPVHFVLLTIFPERVTPAERYDFLLSAQNFFQDPFLRERLKIAETSEEAFEILSREAQTIFIPHRLKYRA